MRKLILLLILVFICSSTLEARSKRPNGDNHHSKFGLHTSLTAPMYVFNIRLKNGEYKSEMHSGRGFHINGFYTFFLNPYLDLALPFGYCLKQYSDSSDMLLETDTTFHYLQLTPQLHIFLGKDRQFFFATGLYIAYLLEAQLQAKSLTRKGFYKDYPSIDLKEKNKELNHFDLGIILGLGYEFQSGLILGYLINLALRDLYDMDITNQGISGFFSSNITSVSSKCYNFEISLGYNFGKLLE